MKVIPASKLVEFINHIFDQMIRHEEIRSEKQSIFNEEKEEKRSETKRNHSYIKK